MATSPIAIAADYADAMMAARRAKNWLFLLVLLAILGQIAIFFVLRHDSALQGTSAMSAEVSADLPSVATSRPVMPTLPKVMEYLVAITGFVGIALALVLAMIQLLIVMIMLVGRLIGVSKVTSAFIWNLVLLVLLFPWQAVLISPVSAHVAVSSTYNTEFKIPGILYTWGEVTHPSLGATFSSTPLTALAYLRWARFVIWPVVAVILLLVVQSKGSRGLRMALGEVEFDVAAEGSHNG
jgi:hypothetical protein